MTVKITKRFINKIAPRKVIRKAYNIKWDTDGATYKECGLPRSVVIPGEVGDSDDEISDWLSDTFGYCHFGFRVSEG